MVVTEIEPMHLNRNSLSSSAPPPSAVSDLGRQPIVPVEVKLFGQAASISVPCSHV